MPWPLILCPDCGASLVRAGGPTPHAPTCPLRDVEHLISEIADDSHDADLDNEEPIPAVSPKDPTTVKF